jgi:hypothetical protein
MRFKTSARLALFREPAADRFDIAITAIEEAVANNQQSVSRVHIRIAVMKLERMIELI